MRGMLRGGGGYPCRRAWGPAPPPGPEGPCPLDAMWMESCSPAGMELCLPSRQMLRSVHVPQREG